jgi:1-acyl-sn-glycerol-3-phosphate acyltransferase
MSQIKSQVRTVWKFAAVMLHIVSGFMTVLWFFPKLQPAEKKRRIRLWALELLEKLDIKLVVTGAPPTQGPMLLAANHISWLDIVVLQATCHCRFVSKADVRRWPLIGTLASSADTLFIERASRQDAMRVVHQMADQLRAGHVLTIFPEGTTSSGVSLLPFHANLFQSAISANVPVLPVALKFVDSTSGQRSQIPCYIGDDTLLGSIWRTLRAQPLCAVVTFGEPQSAKGRDRRTWAVDLRMAVAALNDVPSLS